MHLRSALAASLAAATLLVTALAAPAAGPPPDPGFLAAFTGFYGDDVDESLMTVETDTGTVRQVVAEWATAPTWSADGERLLWLGPAPDVEGTSWLFGARPDGSDRRTVLGGTDVRSVAVAPDGTIAVVRVDGPPVTDCALNPPPRPASVVLLRPDGGTRDLGAVSEMAVGVAFTPDGTRLLWRSSGGGQCGGGGDYQVFVTDLATGTTRQVSGESQRAGWFSFAADGRTVLSAKSDGLGQDLVRIDLDTATSQRLRTENFAESLPAASPDGTRFAIVRTPGRPDPGWIFVSTGPPHVVVVDAEGRELQDLGEVPVSPDELLWAPDASYVLVSGADFVPACPGCDYGGADGGVFRVPLDGSEPTEITDAGSWWFSEFTFQPVFPDPPVVERGTRQLR
jgi:hypothetical protein